MAKQAARGLGRGLSALLEEMGPATNAPVEVKGMPALLPIGMIEPSRAQPRKVFDAQAMAELTDSVRLHGVLQPLLVTRMDGGRYRIVAGERRWRAAQAAGLHEVPVHVREFDGNADYEASIIENVQRADLNPVEEARAYKFLMDEWNYTQEEVARVASKARSHIANMVRILDLPKPVLDMVVDGRLSLGHAKLLAPLSEEAAIAIAEQVAAKQLSVRATEALVAALKAPKPVPAKREAKVKDADLEAIERSIADATGLKAEVRAKGGQGEVVLRFVTLDQLDLVIGKLTGGVF